MKIHCPHCLEETELENSVADSVVACHACKAIFDPRKKDTVPHASDARPELLPGICAGDGFGGYTLERKLGKGGMGVVFEATQLSLGRKVAVKVLAAELLKDPEFVRRFDREARVLASLSHPHIVQVIDKGIDRGQVFLVMEFVDGVSLREVLSEKKFHAHDALKLIPQLCDALEYAHSRGIVHRDIKPENILLSRDGHVKIADFGLAKIVGEGAPGRITRTNAVMGSLDYMAPEQRERTKDADHRADIYALGVVFYEMLTGELPIGRFEPPSKKVKLEVNIDEVVLKVLSKDPEMRYQHASEVAAEIRRRSGETPLPVPPQPVAPALGPAVAVLSPVSPPPTVPRTAGWRAIRGLCDEVATGTFFRKLVAILLLVSFYVPLALLILAFIEWIAIAAREHAAEDKRRMERERLEKEERRRRKEVAREAQKVDASLSKAADVAPKFGLVLAIVGLGWVIALSNVARHSPASRFMAEFAAIALSGVCLGLFITSAVAVAQTTFGHSRGFWRSLAGVGFSAIVLAEIVGLFDLASW